MQDSTATITRSAVRFLSGTFCSRVTGMFRDIIMAFFFGSNPALAAFMVAYRFANLFRRLLGENSIASGFIPNFEAIRQNAPKEGAVFFRDLFFSLFTLLIVVMGMSELVLGSMLYFDLANPQILSCMMWVLPGVVFICLFGLHTALFQSEKKYFLPGIAPVFFNLIWILAVIAFHRMEPEKAIIPFSISVAFAFFVQWIFLMPGTLKFLRVFLSWKECLRPELFSKTVRSLSTPLSLGVIGVASVQINSALDSVFARFADLEGPAFLWYAIRIQQVPLSLFGVAVSVALLPPLSRALQGESKKHFYDLLHFAIRKAFSFMIPCGAALLVLGASVVNLVYGRGEFSQIATKETLICLWGYAGALIPHVLVLMLVPAFQAEQKFRIPTIGAVLSVVINIVCNAILVFVFHMGACSIAVATSIATVINCLYLFYQLHRREESPLFFSKEILHSIGKTLLCTLVASLLTFVIGHLWIKDPTFLLIKGESVTFSRNLLEQFKEFILLAGIFIGAMFGSAWILQAKDLLEILPKRRRQHKLPSSEEN